MAGRPSGKQHENTTEINWIKTQIIEKTISGNIEQVFFRYTQIHQWAKVTISVKNAVQPQGKYV